jgi:hypothetical protein
MRFTSAGSTGLADAQGTTERYLLDGARLTMSQTIDENLCGPSTSFWNR